MSGSQGSVRTRRLTTRQSHAASYGRPALDVAQTFLVMGSPLDSRAGPQRGPSHGLQSPQHDVYNFARKPKPGEGMRMRVRIDQGLCTGDGLCEQIAPAMFVLADDGLSYIKEGDRVYNDVQGGDGVVVVPTSFEDAVVEASQECPGECIFVTTD